MVSSYIYILIYNASRPSFLLILEKYLFLSTLFSNQRALFSDQSVTTCQTSHQTNSHILPFFPLLLPDTACRACLIPPPPAGTAQHLLGSCSPALFHCNLCLSLPFAHPDGTAAALPLLGKGCGLIGQIAELQYKKFSVPLFSVALCGKLI